MQKSILWCLLSLVIGCSQNKIEIGHIQTRTQLDSLMALLPTDSIRIDSLPNRTLKIEVRGNLLLHGFSVSSASFSTHNEQLYNMRTSFPKGYVSFVNKMESLYGLAQGQNFDFTWILDDKEIYLDDDYFSFNRHPTLSDSLGGTYSIGFNPWVSNKITELHSHYQQTFTDYYLQVNTDADQYLCYLNGTSIPFEFANNLIAINDRMPKQGKQELQFIAPNGIQQGLELNIIRQKRGSAKKEITTHKILSEEQIITFEANDLAYTLDYTNGLDLQQIPDLKERMYAHYKALVNAFEQKNESAIVDLLYPVAKAKALTHNWGKKQLLAFWNDQIDILNNNEGYELATITELKVVYAHQGKLARLVPISTHKEASPLLMYIYPDHISYRDYYLYIDSNNQLNFSIQ